MKIPAHLPLAVLVAAFALTACSGDVSGDGGDEGPAAGEAAAMDIETAKAEAAGNMPLGSVPGTVTLPPEARVAVTAPFPGAAVQIFVIEGESVRRGQPLAVVRAAEPLRIGGDLARANSELQVAEAQAARVATLADEGIVASARADEARARLEQARATLAENRRLAALAGAGPDGTMTLRAPITGRLSHVGVETGGPVDLAVAPFVIEAANAYRLDLSLPERLAGRVKPGMPVEVQLPGSGDAAAVTARGRIISVSPSIDPQTRSVMAKATIESVPGLVAGQNVLAAIASPAGPSEGVSVPSHAVTRIGGQPHVFVRGNGGFEPRAVTLAADAGDRAIISEGLAAGETIATSGIPELKAAAE
ncbi:cobalt-zinc-cadmium efflux system membrane fusion protein [Altererythrobacter atlanticus]|uniref:Nickel and cobalt resistance protein CnrB n=1 Tax=Croceibacterium atlanticum TaxID=1267766 RepID=A0A0F7KUP8_9SPHN|nr:efflux RND transporter periplasmic adaptor subunit [Croceibacterium atlanticum]AKH42876.1 Nickel and cobalt resistance protein CnrB [Croceibacterium atlanticum]MBB5731656.1 cobalt-zinc-cadmium efflux system membrane fusion protein [Croceibacterium atlanticum]